MVLEAVVGLLLVVVAGLLEAADAVVLEAGDSAGPAWFLGARGFLRRLNSILLEPLLFLNKKAIGIGILTIDLMGG